MSEPSSPFESCDDPSTSRPTMHRIKSCLKTSPNHSGYSTPVDSESSESSKKRVVFTENCIEEVYEADEWDRTPAEVAQKLSYDDILELKLLQRELPYAQQPYDPLSSRPHSVVLSHVPITLLPLNPTTVSGSNTSSTSSSLNPSPTPSPIRSPPPPPPEVPLPITFRRPQPHQLRDIPPPPPPPRPTAPSAPFIGSNLPPRRNFTFLPLLDTTTSAPPTPSEKPQHSPSLIEVSTPTSNADAAAPDLHDHAYFSDTDQSASMASDTEFSTPSLTTASLASTSSPPPSMPASPSPSPTHVHGAYGRDSDIEDSFALNLDLDADVESDSKPCMPRGPPRLKGLGQSGLNGALPTLSYCKLEAVPSPGLPAPSPLELSGAAPLASLPQQRTPMNRMRLSFIPLMDVDSSSPSPVTPPAAASAPRPGTTTASGGCSSSMAVDAESERGLLPSLSRADQGGRRDMFVH
ncbi:hypothetical protein CONPUDRAFT_166778 [Coniophora puteana RWD-64-598 SS2]|uniref:Uncharacterized protein n=1 Tax=Coniophora puteana (strain RWD-64-598) TaxID=741705 RepID=A0A5M3MII5_CONPW|nr:uncharacterized protein CONPUDRAFT_166778 [Coniophora puteana RWD-64-598 SS2]EIW78913.1 hypothetical protein CONPUDRAFT_166778 [Coniophora puteana RWD-64-598 SS2]